MEPTFQDMQKGEEEDVSQLVEEVFDSLVAPDLVAEGVEEFKRHITPEVLRGKVADENTFILTAKDGRDIVGVIAIRNGISSCFSCARTYRAWESQKSCSPWPWGDAAVRIQNSPASP